MIKRGLGSQGCGFVLFCLQVQYLASKEKWNSMAETGAGECWSTASALGALGDDVPVPNSWPLL